MRPTSHYENRIDQLLQLLCDDRLSAAESAELTDLLARSDGARRRYVEVVQLCVALAEWSQPVGTVSNPEVSAVAGTALNGHATKVTAGHPIRTSAAADSAQHVSIAIAAPLRVIKRWSALAVAVALLIGISLWGWEHFRGGGLPHHSVADSGGRGADRDGSLSLESQRAQRVFVARVVEATSDAAWEDDLQPREFLMRLRAGDQLHLLSGLAHLEFYSGAHVILQGPAKFTPTGPASGKLETGRLTGKVDGGNFLLTTPTAKVVDLGTEFGVTVGAMSNTDVSVFDGEVEVQPGLDGLASRKPPSEAYYLTQGMSVRVAATGKVSDGLHAGVDLDVYIRSFPLPLGTNPKELDLVDIVCGGNGRGARLAAAIDPLTGLWDRRPWNNPLGAGTRQGDEIFHPSSWHPFINGTFIPNQHGNPLQVNTHGQTILLPKDRGHYTWGPIWARRAVRDASQLDRSADSWGAQTYPVITKRLAKCRLGGIGIHASVGITFDLQAIGRENPGQIRRLAGTLSNLDNSKEHNPEWAGENPDPKADFRVFVDGQLRYERLDFVRNVNGLPFEVDLLPSDRFLTFVTMDGGDSNRYDHIIIIDPVLELRSDGQHELSSWQRLQRQ